MIEDINKETKEFKRAQPWVITTVKISPEFYRLAKEHGICIAECLRVGMSLAFAELDICPYDNNLNLFRKMSFYKQELEQAQTKIAELERRNITQEDINNGNTIN